MLYIISGQDHPGSWTNALPPVRNIWPVLSALQEQGRLLLAGPCPAIDSVDPGSAGFTGSLIVAEFPSLEEARNWADADPYVAAGVYAAVEVKPFRKVFPA
jgi:uncharacterized protein YciI